MKLRIASALLAEMEGEAIAAAPFEACGVLYGRRAEGVYTVEQWQAAENISENDRTRHFELDPACLIRAQKAARAGGPQLLGVWHSHPGGCAEPSAEDARCSLNPDWIWLISAPIEAGSTQWHTRAFLASTLDPHHFIDVDRMP